MIMAARVHAGWIKAEDLEKPTEGESEAETDAASEDAGAQG
jgi:N utilization substance protein A